MAIGRKAVNWAQQPQQTGSAFKCTVGKGPSKDVTGKLKPGR